MNKEMAFQINESLVWLLKYFITFVINDVQGVLVFLSLMNIDCESFIKKPVY